MYGIRPEFIHNTEDEERKKGVVAYNWLVEPDSNGRPHRLEELRRYIQSSILKDDRINIEDVTDLTLDMLIHRDYDDAKAMNYEYGVKKTIKSFVYDSAEWAYKKLIARKNGKGGLITVSLEDTLVRRDGKDSAYGDETTIEDTIADKNAIDPYHAMPDIEIHDIVNKIVRINNTVYDGFIPQFLMKCGGRVLNTAQQESIKKILGIENITRTECMSEDIDDVMQDICKYDTKDIVNELEKNVATVGQIMELIDTVGGLDIK